MENATVVTLGPSTQPVQIIDFMDAFGEHSELRGKGRARRQARRQKRKMTRITARTERKAAKQEARQTRKDTRKTRRVARKAIGEEPEYEEELEYEETAAQEVPEDEYAAPETEEQEGDDYDPAAEEEVGEEYFDGDYSQARGKAARQARKAARKERRNPPPPPEPEPEREPEAEAAECFDGNQASAIHPEIKNLTGEIMANREAMRTHNVQKNALIARSKTLHPGRDRGTLREISGKVSALDMEIQRHEARIKDLEGILKKHGDNPQIAQGYKMAQARIQRIREERAGKQDEQKVKATIVQAGLHPEFSNQRIEIPAENQMREVDISSSADGLGDRAGEVVKLGGMPPHVKWAIGFGLVIGGLYLAQKHKLI